MGRLLDLFYNKYSYTDFHELNADWLISSTLEMLKVVDNLDEWRVQHEEDYEELKKLYDDLVAGNFTPEMIDSLYEWTVENTKEIISRAIKMVFFTLTDDGYFIAYIPQSLSEITFGTTGLDIFPTDVDFGHLTLSY